MYKNDQNWLFSIFITSEMKALHPPLDHFTILDVLLLLTHHFPNQPPTTLSIQARPALSCAMYTRKPRKLSCGRTHGPSASTTGPQAPRQPWTPQLAQL